MGKKAPFRAPLNCTQQAFGRVGSTIIQSDTEFSTSKNNLSKSAKRIKPEYVENPSFSFSPSFVPPVDTTACELKKWMFIYCKYPEIKAMGNALGGTIENIVKQTVLLDILRTILDEFRQEVSDSYAPGGDVTIVDDVTKMNEKMPGVNQIAEQIMQQLQAYGRANGMPIFENTTGGSEASSSTRGHIQGITEQTASVMIGQLNAGRIHLAANEFNTRTAVLPLVTIAQNAGHLYPLEAIENMLKEIKQGGSFRDSGL